MGPEVTPYEHVAWLQWLMDTNQVLPAKEMDTSIEALFEPFDSNGQPAGKESDEFRGVRNETQEEKKAFLGEELMQKLAALRKYEDDWLEDIRAMKEWRGS